MAGIAQAQAAEQGLQMMGRRPVPGGPLLVSGLEASRRLGISRRKLYLWLDRGWLPFIRDGRRQFIPTSSLGELVESIKRGEGPSAGG